MTDWPFSGACFWRQKQMPVVWWQKPRYTLPANDTGRKKNEDKFRFWKFYAEIHFFRNVLWTEKCFHRTTSSFIFVYKQTRSAIVCSDRSITVSAFQPVSGTKLNTLCPASVSGTRKVWHTDQFPVPVSWYRTSQLVPETGARNWPVCHHYNFSLVLYIMLPSA